MTSERLRPAAGVLQNETQFSCGSVPNFRGRVEPTMIKPGIDHLDGLMLAQLAGWLTVRRS